MKHRLIKNTTIYGIGSMLNKVIGFLLIPLYATRFSVEEYGVLSLFNLVQQLLAFVLLFGVSTAAMRYYYDEDADEEYRRRVYGSALALLIAMPLLALLALYPAGPVATEFAIPGASFWPMGAIVLLLAALHPLISLVSGLLRIQERAREFVLFHVAFFLAQSLLIVGAVVGFDAGLVGQFWARAIAFGIFWVIALVILIRFAPVSFHRPTVKRLLWFGVPLIPFFVFVWLNKSAGRFMLERFGSLREVGIFALAAQFGGVIMILGNAADNAMMPHFYATASRPGQERNLGRMTTRFVALFGLAALAATVVAEPLILLVTKSDYHEAVYYVPFLTTASWLYIAAKPYTWSLTYGKRSGMLSLLRGFGLAVTLTGLFVLVNLASWGASGVVAAMLLGNATLVIVGYRAAKRAVPLRVDMGQAGAIALVNVGAAAAFHMLASAEFSWMRLLAKLVILALAAVVTMRATGLAIPRLRLSRA